MFFNSNMGGISHQTWGSLLLFQPHYWEFHHLNWRNHLFQRGSNHQPTSHEDQKVDRYHKPYSYWRYTPRILWYGLVWKLKGKKKKQNFNGLELHFPYSNDHLELFPIFRGTHMDERMKSSSVPTGALIGPQIIAGSSISARPARCLYSFCAELRCRRLLLGDSAIRER